MAKVKFVKKARKDNPAAGIKAGDSYYFWSLMSGGRGHRHFSKTLPKPSQLTSSSFMQQYLAIGEDLEEAIQAAVEAGDLESARDNAVSEIESLKDETQGSLDNMPENLQGSATGELLQERVDSLETWSGELEGIDLDYSFEDDKEPEREEGESDEDYTDRLETYHETEEYKSRESEAFSEWADEKRQEITDADPGI
jgi:hypothetical protein